VERNISHLFRTWHHGIVEYIGKSRLANGTDYYFQPDESKVIIGLDVRTWLSSTACENSAIARNENTCSLCLEDIVPEDKMSTFLCGHALHFECANSWISNCIQNNRPAPCPLCNAIIMSPVFEWVPAVDTSEIRINANAGSAGFMDSLRRKCRCRRS